MASSNSRTDISDAEGDREYLDSALARAIFEAAADSILVIDGLGVVQAVNKAALSCFGYVETELLGQNISMLMPASDAKAHDGYMGHYLRTGERKIIGIGRELQGRRKNGEEFDLHLSIGEFLLHGKRMFVGICHDISERRRFTDRIAFLAAYDGLTGCLNRHHFLQSLSTAMRRCRRDGVRLAVLFLDLDGFKAINDNHGHGVGDRLLSLAAERLRRMLREADLLGRVGGDEFAVLLPMDEGASVIEEVASRLLTGLRKPFDLDDMLLRVRASIGVSLFQGGEQTAGELLNEADIAMYQAKMDGGDCVRYFDQALRERSERSYHTLNRLRRTIAAEGFELHYQLQFDLQTLKPSGIEALLRWRNDAGELIMPGDFIPVALAYGLMSDIDRWVLQRACEDNMELIRSGLLDVRMAVNISVPGFGAPGFVDLVRQVLSDTGMMPQRLQLELTEETAMSEVLQIRRNSEILVQDGVSLAIDDFGVGFSSPSRLKELRFHQLKIDRSFIAGLPDNDSDRAIVQMVLGLANALGMDTIAEGVERKEQLEQLQALGCGYGQGYWFARPVPLEELQIWLKEHVGEQGVMESI